MADGDANQARSTVPLFPHSAVSETAIRSICYLPHVDIITRSTHMFRNGLTKFCEDIGSNINVSFKSHA